MRKSLIVFAVLLVAAMVASPALACDGKAATQAEKSGSCATSSAKAAYAKTLAETGSEEQAKAAYNDALAANVYAKSYAETGCTKAATAAARAAVLAETGCEKSAETAATHAVAQAAYDETLATTGCSKSAQAAYDKVAMHEGADCAARASEAKASGCDKGAAVAGAKTACDRSKCNRSTEDADQKAAPAGAPVKVASNETGASK